MESLTVELQNFDKRDQASDVCTRNCGIQEMTPGTAVTSPIIGLLLL
jgi:hypothetical protein